MACQIWASETQIKNKLLNSCTSQERRCDDSRARPTADAKANPAKATSLPTCEATKNITLVSWAALLLLRMALVKIAALATVLPVQNPVQGEDVRDAALGQGVRLVAPGTPLHTLTHVDDESRPRRNLLIGILHSQPGVICDIYDVQVTGRPGATKKFRPWGPRRMVMGHVEARSDPDSVMLPVSIVCGLLAPIVGVVALSAAWETQQENDRYSKGHCAEENQKISKPSMNTARVPP
jgi:hypothetical protein